MQEKRRFGRIPFGSAVTLETAGENLIGKLIDISLRGAKVEFDQAPDLDRDSISRFILALADGITLTFPVEVMHLEGTSLGMKFTQADPDSFSHLLRLMELNTGDPDQVAAELQQFAKGD